MNDITPDDVKFDKDIRKAKIIDYREHGRITGIQRHYYFCEKCQLGWGSLPPYKVRHFEDNGIWYSLARSIKGLMPACPECRDRDHVHKLNRYKKRKGEDNDQSIR